MKFPMSTISINFIIFFFLICSADIILGKWLIFLPTDSIPGTITNKNIKIDGRKIYGESTNYDIFYQRNNNGYRISNNSNDELFKILTIGGSTTDQKFISEGDTFQDYIQSKVTNDFQVINAGIDGQSSYGHLMSLKKWHSKVLERKEVKKIVFLLGVNDIRLVDSSDDRLNNLYDIPSPITRLRIFLKKKSFIYEKASQLKEKFINNFQSADGIDKLGHGIQNPNFLKDNQLPKFRNLELDKNLNEYILLIEQLAITSNKFFPTANIYFVQQQDPKCKYKNSTSYTIRKIINKESNNQSNNENLLNYCRKLGQIYLAQDKALNSPKINFKPYTIKMYIDSPIPDNGFYDGLHTNPLGSKVLGEYLYSKIFLNPV